jgi:leucine dehydrogenase
LNGKYITTIDSGTTQADMSIIKKYTPFVTGYPEETSIENDPSIFTALGVFKGIQSAVTLAYGHGDLAGLHVAIQGVGHVGYLLAKLLHQAGVRLTVCDTHQNRALLCAKEYDANVVEPAAIYAIPCDIFSPCALGQILNPLTIPQLKTKIIAGAANDQLSSPDQAKTLAKRGIFYVPDYLINAGGLIHLSLQRQNKTQHEITEAVADIAQRILKLGIQARLRKKTLFEITEETAVALLKS